MSKDFVVFSRQMARKLKKQGFEIKHIAPNRKNPNYPVFMFEDTPELRSAIASLSRKTPQRFSQ